MYIFLSVPPCALPHLYLSHSTRAFLRFQVIDMNPFFLSLPFLLPSCFRYFMCLLICPLSFSGHRGYSPFETLLLSTQCILKFNKIYYGRMWFRLKSSFRLLSHLKVFTQCAFFQKKNQFWYFATFLIACKWKMSHSFMPFKHPKIQQSSSKTSEELTEENSLIPSQKITVRAWERHFIKNS